MQLPTIEQLHISFIPSAYKQLAVTIRLVKINYLLLIVLLLVLTDGGPLFSF